MNTYYTKEGSYRSTEYKNYSLLHRVDGPAVERANGDKLWYVNGECHRTDGPAIEFANGDKEWWAYGERHRLDGPAIDYINGYRAWWLDGIKITKLKDVQQLYVLLYYKNKKVS